MMFVPLAGFSSTGTDISQFRTLLDMVTASDSWIALSMVASKHTNFRSAKNEGFLAALGRSSPGQA